MRGNDSVRPRRARLDRPDQQPPCAGHAARDRARCAPRARGQVTARDFAQTLGLLGASGSPTRDRAPSRRAPGGRRQWAWRSARRRWPGGHADGARHRPRPRLQRHQRSPRRCCACPAPPCSTTSGPPSSTTSTAAWPARWSCPRRSPPRGSTATARGEAAPLRGPEGGVLPVRLRAGCGGPRDLGLDASRPIVVVSTPPEVSLYHRFENDLFAGVLDRLRRAATDGVQPVVLPRIDAQRAELSGRPGLVLPEQRHRRPVADRARRPGDLGGRHHEPRGGGAGHAGVDHLRGPPRAPSTSG